MLYQGTSVLESVPQLVQEVSFLFDSTVETREHITASLQVGMLCVCKYVHAYVHLHVYVCVYVCAHPSVNSVPTTCTPLLHQCLLVRQTDVHSSGKFSERTQLPLGQLGKILDALFQDGNVLNRAFPKRTAPSRPKTLSVQREAPIRHTASWKVVYIVYMSYVSCMYILPCTSSTVCIVAQVP